MTQSLPLDGIRVLEVGSFFAGPFCGTLLGDLGADVVKIEDPEGGDQIRNTGPFVEGESSVFFRLNHNKRSVALNLKSDEGKVIFLQLVKGADIVVENLRPLSMTRLGLGPEVLTKANPALVYAAVSGWGADGPYAQWPGFDIMAQAMSGIMSITGEANGPPAKAGVPICDLTAALYATIAVLAALRRRDADGVGDVLDISLFESGVSLTQWEAADYFVTGTVPQARGSAHQRQAPYQAVAAADGYFVVGAPTERLWEVLCGVLGREDLLKDPRFSENSDRFRNSDVLVQMIEETTCTRTVEDWLERLRERGVPCGAIQRYDQVMADKQLEARSFIRSVPHATLGDVEVLGSPMHFTNSRVRLDRAGPLLGEHTEEVLREAGFKVEDIARFTGLGAAAITGDGKGRR